MTNGYEFTPATQALATTCLVCGRPLRDAVSVQYGIGPVCRDNIGMITGRDGTPEHREANELIHAATLQAEAGEFDRLTDICGQLATMGYGNVAELVLTRFPAFFAAVVLTPTGDGRIRIKARYLREANSDWYGAGAYWDKAAKARFIPDTPEAKGRVWQVIKKHFPGAKGIGPHGTFTVPQAG